VAGRLGLGLVDQELDLVDFFAKGGRLGRQERGEIGGRRDLPD